MRLPVLLADIPRPLTRAYLLAAGITAFVNIGALIIPFYDMLLFHRVMPSHNLDTLYLLSAGALVGMVLHWSLDTLRSWVFVAMAGRFARDLDITTLRAAVGRSLDGNAAVGAQALRDLHDLRHFLGGKTVAVPLDLMWTLPLLAVLWLLHPAYAYYGLFCCAGLVAAGVLTDAFTRAPLTEASRASMRSQDAMAWTLRHGDVIDGMAMLPALARRWRLERREPLRILRRSTMTVRAFGVVAHGFRMLCQLGVFALGAVLVTRYESVPGSILGANLILIKLLAPFDSLVGGWRQWSFAIAAWQRVHLLIRDGLASAPLGALPIESAAPRGLTVAHLSLRVAGRQKPVLDDVSFAIEPGELLVITGPSGAGKSSLARCLAGISARCEGTISVDGRPLDTLPPELRGALIGYLPQSVSLLDGSVFDNVARMSDAPAAAVIDAAKRARVHELIGRLPRGYDTPVGNTLSGGQKQRIALARALFGEPRLLILDEPNAGLDREGDVALNAVLSDARNSGTAVVLISHRPAVLGAADKILALCDGRVADYGPRETVLARSETGAASSPAPAAVLAAI